MHGTRLAWADLPADLHAWVGQALGAPVVEAVSQPGGFSPGTADRVVTADGTRAFVKAVSPEQNPDTPGLHRREIEVLRTLAGVQDVPQLLDAYDDGHWVALVIEDVEGRHPRLPWVNDELAATLEVIGSLSRAPAPTDWPALEGELVGEFGAWSRLADPLDAHRPDSAPVDEGYADPAPPRLDPWIVERLPELVELCAVTLPRLAGPSVVHTDLRADNVLVGPDGRVQLVDWPWASKGAAWADAAMLLVNVRWSGGLDIRPHLSTIYSLGATHEDVLGAIAGVGGFCTEAGALPPQPGLPTLRAFQREQALACTRLLRELWP